MLKSIWINAWDLVGIDDYSELIAFLRDCGLNACNLGFSYHGGRMLLPRHRKARVYEQDASALYFPASFESYRGLRLQPHVAPESELTVSFLAACRRARFEVNAWTILCHNDRLGTGAPDTCLENIYGDRYTYALCPSNEHVRRYIVSVCGDIASFETVARLDLEALSFMGYDHLSLHDKRGVALTPLITWLLSICVCSSCREQLGPIADELITRARAAIDLYIDELPCESIDLQNDLEAVLGRDLLQTLLNVRQHVIATLLDEIRAVTLGKYLTLRVATSLLFCGGKTALSWRDLAGRVDSATISFFGCNLEQIAVELRRIPLFGERPLPLYGGFMFHYPDSASEEDVRVRFSLLREARFEGVIVYCYGMATTRHFTWLKNVLNEE